MVKSWCEYYLDRTLLEYLMLLIVLNGVILDG